MAQLRAVSFLLCVSLLTGCAAMNKPSAEQIASAEYGPLPENYKEIIQAFMGKLLFDPYSAVFSGGIL